MCFDRLELTFRNCAKPVVVVDPAAAAAGGTAGVSSASDAASSALAVGPGAPLVVTVQLDLPDGTYKSPAAAAAGASVEGPPVLLEDNIWVAFEGARLILRLPASSPSSSSTPASAALSREVLFLVPASAAGSSSRDPSTALGTTSGADGGTAGGAGGLGSGCGGSGVENGGPTPSSYPPPALAQLASCVTFTLKYYA